MDSASEPWRAERIRSGSLDSWSVLPLNLQSREFGTEREAAEFVRSARGACLCASPGSEVYRPPHEAIPEIYARRNPFASKSLALAVVTSVFAILVALVALLRKDIAGLGLAAVFGCFFLCYLLDARALRQDQCVLGERIRFHFWIRHGRQLRVVAATTFVFVLVCWGLQEWATQLLGSMVAVWRVLGVLYPLIDEGEVWRFVTGGVLHYSLSHAATNAVYLSGVIALSWHRLGGSLLVVGVLASTVAAASQYYLGGRVYESYGGLSGAAFGMALFVVTLSARGVRVVPRGVPILFGPLLVAAILGAEVTSPTAATAAHIGGAVFGVFAGVFGALLYRGSGESLMRVQ